MVNSQCEKSVIIFGVKTLSSEMPQNIANLNSSRNPENFTNYLEAEKKILE